MYVSGTTLIQIVEKLCCDVKECAKILNAVLYFRDKRCSKMIFGSIFLDQNVYNWLFLFEIFGKFEFS